MSKITKVCGSSTSTPDPYISTAQAVESLNFWRWGSDNNLPKLLSTISRLSTTHRRIINDKADYISGRGFTFDCEVPLSTA